MANCHVQFKILVIVFLICITGCSEDHFQQTQGYVEGRYIYITTPVSGRLKQLLVTRGSQVKQGDILFTLDEQPEINLYHAAEHDLKVAMDAQKAIDANLEYARLSYQRNQTLAKKKAVPVSELDQSKSIYDATTAQLAQANARVASAAASLEKAKWEVDQKKAYAPVDAVVFDTYYQRGEYTTSSQAILSLLPPSEIKVIFFVPEKELGAVQLGDKISVAYQDQKKSYEGRISFISPSAEYTPPVIYSEQTNEKLIYRVEASFPPEYARYFHPGQPVSVTYYPH